MSEENRPNLRATEAEVISLDDRRGGFDGLTCANCGGAWFKTEGIVLDKHRHVTGYACPITCAECGQIA